MSRTRSSSATRSLRPTPIVLGATLAAGLFGPASAQDADASDAGRLVFKNDSGSLRVALSEEVFGYNEPGVEMTTFLSPDGRSVAQLVLGGGDVYVIHNGVEGERFEGVSDSSLGFSLEGGRLAYVAKRDEKTYAVVDGQLFEHASIAEPGVIFGPGGKRFAWIAGTISGEQMVVVDGEANAPFDGIHERGISFSATGLDYAYVASRDGLEYVVQGGVEGLPFDEIMDFWWSPVGDHLAYVARQDDGRVVIYDGEILATVDGVGVEGFVFPAGADRYAIAVQDDDAWSMLIDGQLEGNYSHILTGAKFSENGARLAYVAAEDAAAFLVIDGERRPGKAPLPVLAFSPEGGSLALVVKTKRRRAVEINGERDTPFDRILEPGVSFSADGSHWMYRAQSGDLKHVVLDGVPGPGYKRIGTVAPAFVEGNRLVYSFRKAGREVVVVDDAVGEPHDKIFGPSFSPDGSRYAYVGLRDGAFRVYIDGKHVATWEHAPSAPLFSPDGARVAYVAGRDREMFVVVDGKEGPHFDHVAPPTLAFTPDGKHLMHVAANADKRFIVIDDLVIDNEYQGFLRQGGILVQDERHFAVRAGRRSVWYLVELEIL